MLFGQRHTYIFADTLCLALVKFSLLPVTVHENGKDLVILVSGQSKTKFDFCRVAGALPNALLGSGVTGKIIVKENQAI